jgi:hypothetical protein
MWIHFLGIDYWEQEKQLGISLDCPNNSVRSMWYIAYSKEGREGDIQYRRWGADNIDYKVSEEQVIQYKSIVSGECVAKL